MKQCLLISKQNIWSRKLFSLLKKTEVDWDWHFDIEEEELKRINPTDIFFFHYSRIVPKEITDKYNCMGFHPANLPFGKGGSPIQNQIKDGITFTKINLFKMTEEVDSGQVLFSKDISLQGNLYDIWDVYADAAYILIQKYLENELKTKYTEKYKRLKGKDNIIDFNVDDLASIYDKIRMLDGDWFLYPKAYLKIGNFKLEFNRAHFDGNRILSDVVIKKIDAEN
jgi:methionyl-tRNA formyltransferase